MHYEGYINYKSKRFTFVYENNFLTLINYDNVKTTTSVFNTEFIDYFEGITVSGYGISFYINDKVIPWNNTYRCFPKIVLISKISNMDILVQKFNSVKFSGGIINKFFPNAQILEKDYLRISESKKIGFKDIESTVKEENVLINKTKATLELSVGYPGYDYDGSIKFNDINSNLRLLYKRKKNYKSVIKDILTINDLFYFCMNRRQISYDTIVLEMMNPLSKLLESALEVYIAKDNNKNYDSNYIIKYGDIGGHINQLLKILSNVRYITYIIPRDDNEYRSVLPTTYASTFSAYQSMYNYYNEKKSVVIDNPDFEELKIEICTMLDDVANRYYKIDSKKRKFAQHISDIIKKSNLKVADAVALGIKKYQYIIETLPDDKYKQAMTNIDDAIDDAVHDRDLITHNDIVYLSDIDIAVYIVIQRIIYAMVLEKIGLKKRKVKNIIKSLSFMRII